MYLVDTDVLIDIQRAYAPALTWFAALTELPAVPGFVVMELIQDAQNAHQVRQALKLVTPLPVVWPTAADCQRALTDFIAYHLSHNLGLLDAGARQIFAWAYTDQGGHTGPPLHRLDRMPCRGAPVCAP